jgi:hypothetical protein
MAPIREIVWPAFTRGDLALNHDLFVLRPDPNAAPTGVLDRGAWNLGMLLGLPGLLSLLPLALGWLLVGVVGWRTTEVTAERPAPAKALRLPVARPPTLG